MTNTEPITLATHLQRVWAASAADFPTTEDVEQFAAYLVRRNAHVQLFITVRKPSMSQAVGDRMMRWTHDLTETHEFNRLFANEPDAREMLAEDLSKCESFLQGTTTVVEDCIYNCPVWEVRVDGLYIPSTYGLFEVHAGFQLVPTS